MGNIKPALKSMVWFQIFDKFLSGSISYLASKLITWFRARMNPMADPDMPNCFTITGRKGRMGDPPASKDENL